MFISIFTYLIQILQFLGLFLTNEKYSNCLFDKTDLCYSKFRQYTYDLHDIISLTITENDFIFMKYVLLNH